MTSKNKIPDDLFLYCKAFDKRNYYCSIYFRSRNDPPENLYGSGDFESIIDATYQAIISGLKMSIGFGQNRRIRIASDIQFVVNQLTYDEPLAAEHLIKKYSEIQSMKVFFSHIRLVWIQRDELISYLSVPDKLRKPREKRGGARLGRVDYYKYIQSEEWKRRAESCKKSAGYRCQVCNRGRDQVKLNAHHRTYENLGNERKGDLICLCRDCHEVFEKNSNHRPTDRHLAIEP